MKTCRICGEQKEHEEFGKNRSRKDGLQTSCKSCRKEESREYYKNNRDKQVKKIYEAKVKRIEENKRFIFDFLSTRPCVDCGESDPRVLEFDHQRDKTMNVSCLLRGGYSRLKIEKEIEKCEVRCANCHRRKTAIDFKWYTHKFFIG